MISNSSGAESSRALICLHGFMGDGGDWEEFGKAFTARMSGWQFFSPTLPGHEDAATTFDGSSFERSVIDWMDSRNISSAAIAGYSLGGRLALRLALDHPNRFPVFIGVSTTAGIDDPAERNARRISDLALAQRLRSCAGRDSFEDFLQEWWSLPVFASSERNVSHREAFLASRLKKSPCTLADSLESWSPGVLPAEWGRLGGYSGKSLLLHGEDDPKFAALSQRMQSAFKTSQTHRLSGAGHQLLVERPAEIAEILARFLNEEQADAAQE